MSSTTVIGSYDEFADLVRRARLEIPGASIKLMCTQGKAEKPDRIDFVSLILPEGSGVLFIEAHVHQIDYVLDPSEYLPPPYPQTMRLKDFVQAGQKMANHLGIRAVVEINLDVGFTAEYGDYATGIYTFVPRKWYEFWKYPTYRLKQKNS